MENIFWTFKDEEAIRPMMGIWPDKLKKFAEPEIDKFLKKAEGQGIKLIKVKIEEIE